MKNRQLLQNTIWFGVIPKLTSLVSMFLMPITTPYLTRNDYGIAGIISSYSALFFAMCTLGLHIHFANSFFEYGKRYKLVWRRLFALILTGTVLFAIIQTVLFLFVLPDTAPYSKITVILLSIIPILFYSNQLMANNYYVLTEKPKPFVTRNLVGGVVSIALSYYFIVHCNYGYFSWLLSGAVSTVILFFMFLKPIWLRENIYPHFSKYNKRIKHYLLVSLPVIPHGLGFSFLASSDRIVMNFFNVDIEHIGLYSNGCQMGEYLNFFILAIFTALAPTLQVAFRSNDKKTLLYYFRLTFFSISTLILLVSFWMYVVYDILVRNETLKEAYHVAMVISFSLLFQTVYAYLSMPVFIKKKTSYILWLVFVPGLLNVFLNILLLPFFGYKCVAYTTVISYWSVVLIPFFHPFYKTEIKAMLGNSIFKELLLCLFAGVILFVVFTAFFDKLNHITLVCASLLILGVYAVIYRMIGKHKNIEILKH